MIHLLVSGGFHTLHSLVYGNRFTLCNTTKGCDAMKECKDQASVLTTLTLNRPSLQTGDCELNLSGSQTSPSLHVNKLYVKKFIYAGHKLLNEARNV